MDRLPDDLAQGSPLANRLAEAVNRAWLARIASHDPEIGDDAYTFGTGLWRSTWHYLEKEFGHQTHRPHNAFYIEFDHYDIYFYGDQKRGASHRIIGGSSVQDHILEANRQYAFDFMSAKEVAGRPRLVGLHTGQSPIGLTRFYVGLPLLHDDPDFAWRFLEPVYIRMDATPPSQPQSKPDVQRFQDQKPPELDVQPERDDQSHVGDSASDGTAS